MVKGSLSSVSMPLMWAVGPRNRANELIKSKLPNVKQRANFCGRITITGKPIKKAINIKNDASMTVATNPLNRVW